jgi:hypothetical protein
LTLLWSTQVLTLILTRCTNVQSLLIAVVRAQEEEDSLSPSPAAEGGVGGGLGGGADAHKVACAKLMSASQEVLDVICDTAHQRCWRLIAVYLSIYIYLSIYLSFYV